MKAESKYYDSYYNYILNGVEPETKELKSVFNIVADLTGRCGIGWAFNDINSDIQDEIIETWVNVLTLQNINNK